MPWVKKNLFILIAGVISLGLLGFAIFFVKGKMDHDAEVTAQLDDAANKFKDLIQRKNHPGTEKQDNIKAAKEELAKVRTFMDELREYIKGPEVATNMNNQQFRALLDTSLTQMRREAEESNVTLPSTNYWFTFSTYKTTVDFKGDVAGLAAQLEDIKLIMRILNNARVHSLAGLKRVPVSDTDFNGGSDYLNNRQPRTNDWAITTGYEVTFQGFSSELARVMEGFANAKECFVVKSLGVAQAPEERKAGAPVIPMAPPMMNPMGMNPYGMDRYRYAQRPQIVAPVQQAKPSISSQTKTVLDENKLRFTVTVDSVRLKPKQK
jgi:hypothetical protein